MSRVIFEEEYIIVIPSFKEVKPHQHDFYHMFFLEKESGQEIFVTGSKMLHTMPPLTECRLFLIIDPTSDLAGYLHDQFLMDGTPERIRPREAFAFSNASYLEDKTDEEIRSEVRRWLLENGFLSDKEPPAAGEIAENKEPIDDYRNDTYIQSEGINQDFGIYDSPDELLAEHGQEIGAVKGFIFRHLGRHLMNRNVWKVRALRKRQLQKQRR